MVGAGPAGSTAAMFLARQGFQVEVHERRPEPKNDPVDTGRAYIIILIPRGQAALKDVSKAIGLLPSEAIPGVSKVDRLDILQWSTFCLFLIAKRTNVCLPVKS